MLACGTRSARLSSSMSRLTSEPDWSSDDSDHRYRTARTRVMQVTDLASGGRSIRNPQASLPSNTVLDERQLRVTTEGPLGTRGSHELSSDGVLVKERQTRARATIGSESDGQILEGQR